MARASTLALLGAALSLGCGDPPAGADEIGSETEGSTSESSGGESEASETDSAGTSESAELPETIERWVKVTLDGAPLAGATVMQGGTGLAFTTDAEGRVLVTIDTTIPGDLGLMASHELARTKGAFVLIDDPSEMLFELATIAPGDNEQYLFNPPGVPDIEGSTAQCGHCHNQLKTDWFGSPHRTSASNPKVQDIYAGVATAFADQASCTAAGGNWWTGVVPGTRELAPRCYLGVGTLPDLDGACGQVTACDGVATEFGACADCHAPAIDGPLGGRDLLEASGSGFADGVHCDLCHKVESIDLDAPPGVGGRLQIHRPVEPSASPGVGEWAPLAFGPYADVPNPRMGASPRDHFLTAEFCAGCHQYEQAVLLAGASLDPLRWPEAVLPTHSTYDEWRGGPFVDVAPCSSCHMPADPEAGNGADLSADVISMQGFARGWLRPPGAVRQHTWVGPRTPSSNMLHLAAAIFVDTTLDAGTLTAEVTVRNVGAGHAIPTGEPLRSLVLFVQARCGDQAQVAIDGDAIPDFGGWLDRKLGPEDWSVWPGAQIGDVVRVVEVEGWIDYLGFGPFGDGSFAANEKGLAKLRVVGESTVIAVLGDQVTFATPLPVGDIAYRGRPAWFDAEDPLAAAAVAGAPGFAFARVLADDQGQTMVPHHRAVDVVSDNRILPQQQWTSTHVFAVECGDPIVDATLVHRPYPVALANERGWINAQQVMVEVSE
ncbi:hypothetical protein ACNOYE_36305 [Nannocystaceae bacterium ST9]